MPPSTELSTNKITTTMNMASSERRTKLAPRAQRAAPSWTGGGSLWPGSLPSSNARMFQPLAKPQICQAFPSGTGVASLVTFDLTARQPQYPRVMPRQERGGDSNQYHSAELQPVLASISEGNSLNQHQNRDPTRSKQRMRRHAPAGQQLQACIHTLSTRKDHAGREYGDERWYVSKHGTQHDSDHDQDEHGVE